MSLYFKVPQPDRDRLRPLVRLMLQLIFNRLMEQLDPDRHHLLLMLDEFPELRKIPNLSAAMSLMAGYKIKPYLIAQTLTQIIEEYGPNESITDNCYIKAAFQTDNLQTCKNLSELSGNMTVEKETVNYSGQRTDFYLKHIFRSVEQVQRPLITVDEIRRIKPPTKATNDPNSKIIAPGDMLIFINGVAPIYGVQSLYFLNKTLLARTKLKPPEFPNRGPASPVKPARAITPDTRIRGHCPCRCSKTRQLRSRSMEILNQVILAGNLTDQPTVSDAGGRQFVRARLAQSWFYDTQGRTVEHRQFLPITFFGESAIVAKILPEGRQHPRDRPAHPARAAPAAGWPKRRPRSRHRSSRFTSFALSASRPVSKSEAAARSTKTIFAAPTTRSRFRHSFRRVSMIGLFKRSFAASLCAVARLRCVFRADWCTRNRRDVSLDRLRRRLQLHALSAIRTLPGGVRVGSDDSRSSPLRLLLPRPSLAVYAGRAELPRPYAYLPRWLFASYQARCGLAWRSCLGIGEWHPRQWTPTPKFRPDRARLQRPTASSLCPRRVSRWP